MEKNRIIGICGGSASGKTSISKKIGNMYENDITLLSQDSYYKSNEGKNMMQIHFGATACIVDKEEKKYCLYIIKNLINGFLLVVI